MFQLIIHNQGTVLEMVPSLSSVEVKGNTVKWLNGEMREIQSEFVLLPDEEQVGEMLTSEQIDLDQKANLKRIFTDQELKEALQELLNK